MENADITILGAGPVGSALALLLARTAPDPARIVLCHAWRGGKPRDAAGPSNTDAAGTDESGAGASGAGASGAASAPPPASSDPRALALNHGSRVLLEGLGAWPGQGAPIHTVHVSQQGRLGRTLIRHTDFGVSELGTVHQYGRVQEALHAALEHAGITLLSGDTAVITSQSADDVGIVQGRHAWRSRIAVQAEGGGYDNDPAALLQRDYNQVAVLALVRASRPCAAWAWERFTREGPLALLPIHAGAPVQDNNDLYSLVWCCRPEQASRLRAMSDADFSAALGSVFGARMGTLQAIGPRHTFALGMKWKRDIVQGRRVTIGNAAQTLHPVAGQGLNLGLRDAARLAQELSPWQQAAHTDPGPLLQRFSRARRPDRLLTAAVTDFLPRIFATGRSPVEHAGGLALLALDTLPLLRRPLARHLMHGLRA